MKKLVGGALLLVLGASMLAGCTFPDSDEKAASSSASATATTTSVYPSPSASVNVLLTITVQTANAGKISTRQLACSGDTAVSPTNFDGGDAACRLVQASGNLLTETMPTEDPKACRETGDAKVADVFGQIDGVDVRQSFRRNTTCGAERWDKVIPLLGPTNNN